MDSKNRASKVMLEGHRYYRVNTRILETLKKQQKRLEYF